MGEAFPICTRREEHYEPFRVCSSRLGVACSSVCESVHGVTMYCSVAAH